MTFRIYLFYRLREPITEDFDNFGWIRPAGVIDGKILGTATAFPIDIKQKFNSFINILVIYIDKFWLYKLQRF